MRLPLPSMPSMAINFPGAPIIAWQCKRCGSSSQCGKRRKAARCGGGRSVVCVGAAAGAGDVDHDALRLVGGGLGFGGLGVLFLAVHHALAVEEELGDVGHGGGVAAGDALVGEIF